MRTAAAREQKAQRRQGWDEGKEGETAETRRQVAGVGVLRGARTHMCTHTHTGERGEKGKSVAVEEEGREKASVASRVLSLVDRSPFGTEDGRERKREIEVERENGVVECTSLYMSGYRRKEAARKSARETKRFVSIGTERCE